MLTRKIISFVEAMHPNKKVTGKDFPKMHREQYWLMSRYLRDNGIITVNGVNDRNERMWILTDKGKRFTELAVQIRNIIDGVEEDNN